MKINKDFLKNFKKNDIVIYAIALMLVTAGYFNYTANLDNGTIETYSEDINATSELADANNTNTNIGDARLVNSNDVVIENNEDTDNEYAESEEKAADSDDVENKTENTSESEDESNKDNGAEDEIKIENDTNTENDSSDYFVSSKLERDQNYASMISTYTQILEDSSVSETQKSIAIKEITEINDTKNAIAICENLLSTKGFTNSVILINNDSVNVVVEVEGGLTTDKVAQIQNVISRELGTEIENIHISENE